MILEIIRKYSPNSSKNRYNYVPIKFGFHEQTDSSVMFITSPGRQTLLIDEKKMLSIKTIGQFYDMFMPGLERTLISQINVYIILDHLNVSEHDLERRDHVKMLHSIYNG